jgi:hypothetical protein
MRRRRNYRAKTAKATKLDTVGVVGSIPIAPTIPTLRGKSRIIEIPEGYSVLPYSSYRNGRFRLSLVIVPNHTKKCEKSVGRRRRG